MKNTSFKFLLLILIFSSMSLRGMSCTINNINANVSTILDILENLNTSGIDVNISGLDQLVAEISLVEQTLLLELAIIESQLEAVLSMSATDELCTLISMPTTISVPGTYCLSQDIAGTITINSSNVTLNLNGHQVTMGIQITAGNDTVSITNGTVLGGSPGILVQAGCTNISITSVLVKNGTSGILFEQVNGALVKHCTLTSNMTGLTLLNSSRINVFDTIATANTYAGFDLLSSSTNSFIECKALSTGQGNTVVTNNFVTGFSSYNGYGNIFERCIANGTQALSTTDANSLVAGFALLGSESNSKIIGCESANATASTEGVTVPYGIFVEYNINDLLTTVTQGDTDSSNSRASADWSPDGKYLITSSNGTILLYEFDRVTQRLILLATTPGLNEYLEWSPSGNYFLAGEGLPGEGIDIYSFDKLNNSINPVCSIATAYGTGGVAWSPDEQFIVFTIVDNVDSNFYLNLYEFDSVRSSLTFCNQITSTVGFDNLSWSSDGNYIAVSITNGVAVYLFNRSLKTLSFVNQYIPSPFDYVHSVDWSFDGKYIALSAQNNVHVCSFNGSAVNLVTKVLVLSSNLQFSTVGWSPDGKFIGINQLAVGGIDYINEIYSFDRSFGKLAFVAGILSPLQPTGQQTAFDWSPDGAYIACSIAATTAENTLIIAQAFTFASQNVITDNTVYCNGQSVMSTFTGAVGVGISGSSIANMIIGNTAYNNPPVSTNTFVPSNYQFVTNIFNPLFGQAPSALQNISLNANDPITAPTDIGLLAQQILFNVTVSLPSQLEAIEATLIAAVDKISLLGSPCSPTAITTGTTITAAGNYCVAESIMNSIVINASDVNLDLNNRTVTGTITVAAAMSGVTISNGTINANGGASGILVNPGASNISISNVTVKNAITGIDFMSASDATIQGCTLTQNTTGLQLNSSYNVQVSDTVASSNVNAGFDLLSSFTNSFISCKALSTGQGNSVIYNNEVVGFSSLNGYGNIFERCIANGTQALSSTDSSSLVAGFALRGSESCSKIIGCESANANASGMGVTVPYGILLQGTVDLSVVLRMGSADFFSSIDWSPDGQYIAVGMEIGSVEYGFQIYSFDRINNTSTAISGALNTHTDTISSINWSPDGRHLAVVGGLVSVGYGLQIYTFDPTNNSLTAGPGVLAPDFEDFASIDWSPNGQYVAVCAHGLSSGYGLQIYSFDSVMNTLMAGPGALSSSADIPTSLNWSPDGQYVAVCGQLSSTSNGLQIYSFNQSVNTLTPGPGALAVNSNFSVAWSPDGQYLAVGASSSDVYGFEVFRFNRPDTLIPGPGKIDYGPPPGNQVASIAWSPDGQYIVVVGNLANSDYGLLIYDFQSSDTLISGPGALSPSAAVLQDVSWSPDGQYVASCDVNGNFDILQALQFPSQNVITDNTIYCNGHDVSNPFTGAVGVGISGTSICNMIIGNTAYNNPPTTSNFFVPSNYYFVTNVFNPLFGQAPTELQNISLNACDPIVAPVDIGLLAQQILYNIEASIPSQLDVILAAVESGGPCGSITITTGTTITAAGNYCVANSLNGNIVINTGDVNLNLNNRTVTGTITIARTISGVTISNGTINANGAASGILVNPGASDITISNVTVKNAITGIDFMSASDATIQGCTLTQNITGLQLNRSYNVQVSDTVASSNMNAGFDLISSFTNSFINCKALSTGQNNAVIYNNEVAGFSSYNGYGNIFERCIANGTQALSTTDSSSLIAGFALRGSESCSKIIGCESANANTSGSGVTVPYGILLQKSLSDVSTATAIFFTADNIYAVEWSPDGQYIAVGGDEVNTVLQTNLQIFRFDRPSNTFTAVAGAFPYASTGGVKAISWSPDGLYLAVGGYNLTSGLGTDLQIFSFDSVNNTLIPVAGAFSMSSTVLGLSWSPNEQYVAMGGQSLSSGNLFQVFSFDRITNAFTSVAGDLSGTQVNSVDWSPDGNYIAVGGFQITGGYISGDMLQIYSFNQSTNSLTRVAANVTSNGGTAVWALEWHPNGQYLAISGGGFESGGLLQLFLFDRTNNALTLITSTLSGTNAWTMAWSPDGNYIVVGGYEIEGYYSNFQIFSFDAAGNFNTLYSSLIGTVVWASSWSPDGQYISIGGTGASLGNFEVFTGLNFPSQNVITDNTVYCNGHDVSATFTGAVGVGISGTSICNMIIGNTAYNNPPTTSNFFVPSNYYFVTNVFNPLYGQAPTELQNISLNACDPIVAPVDIGLLAQQILYNVEVPISSQLDVILAAVEGCSPCVPTAITTGTTITAAGNYCVAKSLTSNGNIVINTSDVNFDLNNRTVTGTITVAAAMSGVTISNGTINAHGGASGILVNSGASDITISNVTIKNATTGIDFMSAYDATIAGCTLTQNIIGLQLNSSYNVQVSDTVASSNMNAGFDLISSFTNSFINCKALSTGQNNAVIYNNEVVGFSSYNGYGNIFERCIANGTQALSTTDSSSFIAGFAFFGSESCSKIIGCESANANASGNGVTVPYGILLQGTLDSTFNVTGALSANGDIVVSVNWSPDGQYVAIGGGDISDGYPGNKQFQIFEFDRVTNLLTPVAGALSKSGDEVLSVNWSPDGQYVAIGGLGIVDGYPGNNQFQIFEFNRSNNNLTPVAGVLSDVSDNANSVDWSPDGQYVAIGGNSIRDGYPGNNQFQIFEFNRSNNNLTPVAGALSDVSDDQLYSVNWSPDGQYVAIGGYDITDGYPGNNQFQIFEFNRSNNNLTPVAGALRDIADDIVVSVNWSPDGQYVAIGGLGIVDGYPGNNQFQIFEFNRSNNNLTPVAGALSDVSSDKVYSVDWSPDGQYVAVGGKGITDGYQDAEYQFQIFEFNRSNNNLTPVAGSLPYTTYNTVALGNWSPDGQYVAIGGNNENSGKQFEIFTGIQFPSQNVITDNTVYCNGHDVSATFTGAVGVGISGTSICNMIIGNTVYNNPPITSNFFVPSNYYFVTNVFNQAFGQGPTALQNISLNACDPIVAPLDVALISLQNQYLMQSIIAILGTKT